MHSYFVDRLILYGLLFPTAVAGIHLPTHVLPFGIGYEGHCIVNSVK